MAKVVIRKKGKKPLVFEKGGLHRSVGVPEGEPIPKEKIRAALSGKYGPKAKKQAVFAFKGALAAGRKKVAGAAKGAVMSSASLIGQGLDRAYGLRREARHVPLGIVKRPPRDVSEDLRKGVPEGVRKLGQEPVKKLPGSVIGGVRKLGSVGRKEKLQAYLEKYGAAKKYLPELKAKAEKQLGKLIKGEGIPRPPGPR